MKLFRIFWQDGENEDETREVGIVTAKNETEALTGHIRQDLAEWSGPHDENGPTHNPGAKFVAEEIVPGEIVEIVERMLWESSFVFDDTTTEMILSKLRS